MAAGFESGAAEAEVVGQEAREGACLGHRQQPARADRGEDLGEDAIGIGHVVQGHGRPGQVDGADGRPRRVQVRLFGADPVGQAEIAGLVPEPVKQRPGFVQGDHVGSLEALEQGQGAGTGTGAQVEDPAAGQIGSQVANPAGYLGQKRVQYLAVKVQQLGHGRPVGLGSVLVLVVFHAPTLRCHALMA